MVIKGPRPSEFYRRIKQDFLLFENKIYKKNAEKYSNETVRVPLKASGRRESAGEESVFVAKPPPDVRLILFRECKETSDRNILFDSKTIKKNGDYKYECPLTRNNNTASPQYQLSNNPKPKDWGVLSEMLFGAVGMASKTSSLKIHLMREPPSLMLSRVYSDSASKDSSTPSLERGIENMRFNNSLSSRRAKTLPVATPETPTQLPSPTVAHSLTSSLTRITRSDSSTSLLSMFGSLGTPVMRIPASTPKANSLPQTARNANRDTFAFAEEMNGLPQQKAKIKIGLAIILTPEPSSNQDFNKFVFNHFPIIESYITRLKEQVEHAMLSRRNTVEKLDFIVSMMTALEQFSGHLVDLYCTPRLIEPMWKTLTVKCDLPWRSDQSLIAILISDISILFRNHNRNNFFSSLISTVLTYHLGWVSTVTSCTGEELENREMINYNPLWAQLGDIYGSMCSPTRVSKTIVTGEVHQKVSTIISVLSYFIRCTQVEEALCVPDILEPQNVISYDNEIAMNEVKGDHEESFIFITKSPSLTNSLNEQSMPSQSHGTETKIKNTNLHRSRSSPFGASNHNSSDTNLCHKHRAPSTDSLSRSRFVQSRRKSNYGKQPIQFTISSDAITIPNNLKLNEPCEGGSSCPIKQPSATTDNNLQDLNKRCFDCNNTTRKTHKRVNSEPFKIQPSEITENKDVIPRVKCQENTFVGNLAPKIEHIVHVQSEASFPRRLMKENIPPMDDYSKNKEEIYSNCNGNKNGVLRRESSGKNKRKTAARRHQLDRTPSVQLNHDEFDDYFTDDSEKLQEIHEVKFCEIKKPVPKQQEIKPNVRSSPPARPPPPLPSRPPVHGAPLYPALSPATQPLPPTHMPLYPKLPPLQSTTALERPTSLFLEADSVQQSIIPKIYPVLPNVGQTLSPKSEKEFLNNDREELPLATIQKKPTNVNSNFGYSNLMADYSPKYLWNFALFGAQPIPDISQNIVEELDHAVKRPVLDETIAESVCIHADADRNSVSVYSSHRLHSGQTALPALSSKLVTNMLERVVRLHTMKVPVDFCVMQLESELTQLVLKSRMLAEYVRGQTRVAVTDLSKVLGIEKHDLPLLMAIASCYSPQVGAVMT